MQASKGTAASLWGYVTAMWGSPGTIDVPLPTAKLTSLPCDSDHPHMVLVNCGSFNPPTIMHLRIFDVAAQTLRKVIERNQLLPFGPLSQYTGTLPCCPVVPLLAFCCILLLTNKFHALVCLLVAAGWT